PCCMGDLLMATPAFAALRKSLPDSHIALSVGEYSLPTVRNNPNLDALVDAGVPDTEHGLGAYMGLGRYLRRNQYGTALVLDRSPMLNMAAYLSRAHFRAGLDSAGRGVALTHPVPCPPSRARHEVEWYLDVVRAIGIKVPSDSAYLEFYPTEEDKQRAGQVLSEALGEEGESEYGLVALHLGGGANPGMNLPGKRWQPERWARVADWIAETYEANILILGGPGEQDREAAEAFMAALFPDTRPYVADLVGKLQWGEMGALLQRCSVFLGHDTGAMHLATAVRTPVVAVFGPSDPLRYGPWDPSGRSVVVAPGGVSSGAESLRQAAAGGGKYHDMVTADEVWAAVQRVFSQGRMG
ncbi:MAG: glycosyltransferase family 9 protein, partial [Chloroflexota bacterium]|nr:glycosyltransferase family 9 protein [Chloroflexota bacterium]